MSDSLADEIVRLQAQVIDLEQKLSERTKALQEALAKNEQLITTDALTGAANRRHFMVEFERLLLQASRTRRPFSLLIIDLEQFKAINAEHGQVHGDAVLRDVAHILRDNARSIDILGRMGGDEFALALPETDLAGAITCAERLERGVGSFSFVPRDGEGHALQLAVGGCVLMEAENVPADAFLRTAEKALVAAQHKTADRVVCLPFGAL